MFKYCCSLLNIDDSSIFLFISTSWFQTNLYEGVGTVELNLGFTTSVVSPPVSEDEMPLEVRGGRHSWFHQA